MSRLFRQPVARFIVSTALVGSLADWILFATLVVTVDALLGGGPWATALVLLVRILPGALFAPVAARRVDGAGLPGLLVRHEALRVGAVAGLAAAFVARSVPGILAGFLALEFAAAMQAAARESTISRHVPASLFTPVNTVTAVLAYGFLPLGAVAVAQVGATTGWTLAIAGYVVLTAAYRVVLPRTISGSTTGSHPRSTTGSLPRSTTGSLPRSTTGSLPRSTTGSLPRSTEVSDGRAGVPTTSENALPGSWQRVTVAAALGILPAVALFALGPTLAESWLGDRAATGPLYATVLGGGAVGFAAANLRWFRAEVAMLLAAAGLVVAAGGWWVPGLVLLGAGAGGAYLDLQTRLQHAADDPSEFAAAFAILKVASAVAVAGAPALATVAPLSAVLVVGAIAAVGGAAVASAAPVRALRLLVRGGLELLGRAVIHVDEINPARRVDGPAVVVSNHPHWADGLVALLADRSLRPIARWQASRGARLGIWAADAVVTTAGTDRDPRPAFAQAADHLRAGGRVWLAPEGGAHADPQLRAPRSGAVRMAHLAGVPIQPLAITWVDGPTGPDLGRWRPWRRRVARVTWGRPVVTTGDVAADNQVMMMALATTAGLVAPEPELAAAA